MILLWGVPGDSPIRAVRDALHRLGENPVLLDQRHVLRTEMELHVGAQVAGQVRVQDHMLDLSAVTAVYARPYDVRRISAIAAAGPGSQEWAHALELEDALLSWIELTSALVVNLPSAMAANTSKPYQAGLIRAFGFAIPETLITTDPSAALAFWQQHGTVIYKSVSSTRSIVARLTPAHRGRLEDVVWCPTQFQRYVPGQDIRVHIVGDEIFASRIDSDADDYRYAAWHNARTTLSPHRLPDDIAARCCALAKAMRLPVAGIDLRCTPEGEWYCFEVNPSPAFTYFQAQTSQAIDEAVAQLLLRG